MGIWHHEPSLDALNSMLENTMDGHLGIQFTEAGDDYIKATMPVDERTRQPFGLLHGGASVVLAESLGSVAAHLCVDPATRFCVGLEINANHVRAVRKGTVTGTATPLHIGGRTQVWEIKIRNEKGQLTCVSRITLSVQTHKHAQ